MRRVLLVLVLLVAGCSSPADVRVEVEPTALADAAAHVKVSGLGSGDAVEIVAETADSAGKVWKAAATYKADGHGVVDLDRAAPTGGSYAGVDGMGLFWGMNSPDGDPEQQYYLPEVSDGLPRSVVRFSVRDEDGKTLATATQTRRFLNDGETNRTLTLAHDKVVGRVFLPKPDGQRHPGVLLLGGSEGGMSLTLTAALLAAYGFPSLTVAYFGEPGLPKTLKQIPLEYFETAAKLLAAQPSVDPRRMIALGVSRGAEASLLMAQDFPALIHGAVLYAPTSKVAPGFPDYLSKSWTLHGTPLAEDLIPVDRVSGPVLAVAGTADGVWQSAPAAQLITTELDAAHNRHPHKALIYPGAGHNVGTYPYVPQGTQFYESAAQHTAYLGGSRPVNAAAQADAWPQVLALLRAL
ncbi:acyl-CoA thioesterase/bile acid-CoA:amino acid N-acyltransferase family protein [Kribbella sp. NPDC051770]|uniref:acyl-CoA thioesterase/bile acid-CoA:amino acid N-acyltransferase family protein n=1 Tax=Kribbella sp. NPDC051770 TaxID=3155413 RepID=UPI003415A207